ncbi:MAG: hypothetical protein R8J84_03360 [Mariprofundales bacterium]
MMLAGAFLLTACSGIYANAPVGKYGEVGAHVDRSGNVNVNAGVRTPAGTVGGTARLPDVGQSADMLWWIFGGSR